MWRLRSLEVGPLNNETLPDLFTSLTNETYRTITKVNKK